MLHRVTLTVHQHTNVCPFNGTSPQSANHVGLDCNTKEKEKHFSAAIQIQRKKESHKNSQISLKSTWRDLQNVPCKTRAMRHHCKMPWDGPPQKTTANLVKILAGRASLQCKITKCWRRMQRKEPHIKFLGGIYFGDGVSLGDVTVYSGMALLNQTTLVAFAPLMIILCI